MTGGCKQFSLSFLTCSKRLYCKTSSINFCEITKANKPLVVLGSLRKEGMSQEEVDHLFNTIFLPNFSYALLAYGASDSDLSVIQIFFSF